MTEYELAELISIISSNLLTNITVILTIVSFYIIAAYAVGDKLTLAQVTVLNGIYIAASYVFVAAFLGTAKNMAEYVIRINELSPNAPEDMTIEWARIVAGVLVSSMLGSFYFMWSIRHPKGA
jgi:hypothetical protein